MTDSVDVFHFDDGKPNFESFGKENGFRYWLASDLQEHLGYATLAAMRPAINKAIAACATLNIPVPENFVQTKNESGADDFKLSRFACYLTVMNGDTKKPLIAKAQAYFASLAESFRQYYLEAEQVERVQIRGEVSEREKALNGTVATRGVTQYAFFQNAGYRGMYNMDMSQIRRRKGVPGDRSPLDFMGKTELAANLFRITQTDEKIRNEDIHGQKPLEAAAHSVGREVRATMQRISGTTPEGLLMDRDIKEVRKDLKKTGKEFAKLDGPKPKKGVS